MKISFPFLATRTEQLQPLGRYGNDAVEAVLFNGADLEGESWVAAWRNVRAAVAHYGPGNVTFHFPVDDADYVAEPRILTRVEEALQRATDLGLHGVVIHSNRIRRIAEWATRDLVAERSQVAETLAALRARTGGETWLALENMPIMDNWGKEIDPLFVFPADFAALAGTGVGVVWDFCHYSSTLAALAEVAAGLQDPAWYPNRRAAEPLDFVALDAAIRHWHFSAFRGVANPATGATCREGVLPGEGDFPASLYAAAWNAMLALGGDRHAVFEVQEPDYRRRDEAERLGLWTLAVGGADAALG